MIPPDGPSMGRQYEIFQKLPNNTTLVTSKFLNYTNLPPLSIVFEAAQLFSRSWRGAQTFFAGLRCRRPDQGDGRPLIWNSSASPGEKNLSAFKKGNGNLLILLDADFVARPG